MQIIKNIIKTPKHVIRVILLRTWDAISPCIPDRLFIRVKFYLRLGYWPNLSNPRTFNEKLQWLKLNNQKDIYTTMVDKFKAKEYIRSIIGDKYIVPTLGVWDRTEDIDFDTLPDRFVLKVTHDSGGVCICGDKKSFDKERFIRKLSQSLVRSYFYQNREWPYKNVERKIIAEEFLGDNLQDYRVYCFNGEPKLIYSYTNRSETDGSKPEPTFCDIMDIEWHPQPFRQMCHPRGGVDKPAHLSEMLRISKILSRNIPFVRVDFYEGKQLLVGELTFYPGSGMSKFFPSEMDGLLGEWIKLEILQ